jgi:predicted DNA-binding transcriptional regulator YafY
MEAQGMPETNSNGDDLSQNEDMEHSGPDRAALGAAVEQGASRVPKTERILNLIAFLLRCREPVPVEQILAKVRGYDDQASRDSLMRRFERDKKVLREMGVPLQFCPAGSTGEGYLIPRDSYYLSECELPARSLELLRAMAAASARGPGGRLRDDLRSALLKLGFDAGSVSADVIASANNSLKDRVLDLKISSSDVSDRLEALSEAVLLRRRVRFTYYTIGRDATSQRTVDPYGIGFWGQGWHRGAWYLVGRCQDREAVRVFRVSRIRGEVSWATNAREGGEFELPDGFRVSDHLARPQWELNELAKALRGGGATAAPGAALDVVLRVDATVANEICELIPSAQRRADPDHESSELLSLTVSVLRPFLRFLLRSLGHVEIVEPRALLGELAKLASEVRGLYEKERPS